MADNVRVTFINVGKGDCILLEAGRLAALIDTGYESTSEAVISSIRSKGVNHLEFLVLTHYDRDHIGGVRALGKALSIGMLFLPAYEGADKNYRSLMVAIETMGLKTSRVTEKVSLRLGDALVSIKPSGVSYAPHAKGNEGNDNDLSLVTSLTSAGQSFLFTGDIENDGILDYLRDDFGRFDVLKVPCHGKKCDSTDDLIERVKPRIAVITDSSDDPADKKTLKILEKIGADVYRMSTDGTTTVEGDVAGSYTVSHLDVR